MAFSGGVIFRFRSYGKVAVRMECLGVRSWLQGDMQPPEFDFCSTPKTRHSVIHAGLPLLTHRRHRARSGPSLFEIGS